MRNENNGRRRQGKAARQESGQGHEQVLRRHRAPPSPSSALRPEPGRPPPIFQPKPKIVATVSVTEQKMFVAVTDNRGKTQTFVWEVTTGKDGFDTPKGQFTPDLAVEGPQVQPVRGRADAGRGVLPRASRSTARTRSPGSNPRLAWLRPAEPGQRRDLLQPVEAYGKFNTKIVVTG
jgi:hypothetical protein